MATYAVRLCALAAAILVAREVGAFATPSALTSRSGRALPTIATSSLQRSSRRWDKPQNVDATNAENSAATDQVGGPFPSWVKKAAGRFGRGPFSRTAKKEDEVDDLLNSEAFLNKKVEMLKKQIKVTQEDIEAAGLEADKEWEEWGPQVQRLEKEFDLLKSRGGEAVTKAFAKGKATALNDILSVADNFERASAAISAETDGERAVVEYYRDAYDTMMGCLESLGLTEVETLGAAFDYNIHNAIMRENTNEYKEDEVCKVFQKGYQFGDTLVRPAMVAVAVPA